MKRKESRKISRQTRGLQKSLHEKKAGGRKKMGRGLTIPIMKGCQSGKRNTKTFDAGERNPEILGSGVGSLPAGGEPSVYRLTREK